MSKFTILEPNVYGNTHLSFFIWREKVYPIGTSITLTKKGDNIIRGVIACDYIVIESHYFEDAKEKWAFGMYFNNGTCIFKKSGLELIPIEDYIESIGVEPLNVDVSEYTDWINTYIENYHDKRMTWEEYKIFKKAIQNGSSVKTALPERLKDKVDELDITPMYTDFTAPGMIFGWIVFIAFVLGVSIFKGWCIPLILRVYAVWHFARWRQKKLWGFNEIHK